MDIISELEKRIADKRKELEEEEKALEVVRRMVGKSFPAKQIDDDREDKSQGFKFEDLLGSVEKKRTLLDEIRDVVSNFGDNEFTVAHIEAALNAKMVKIDAKAPRARIGIVMAQLVEEELVIRTYQGAGNVPHRYKLKSAISNQDQF